MGPLGYTPGLCNTCIASPTGTCGRPPAEGEATPAPNANGGGYSAQRGRPLHHTDANQARHDTLSLGCIQCPFSTTLSATDGHTKWEAPSTSSATPSDSHPPSTQTTGWAPR